MNDDERASRGRLAKLIVYKRRSLEIQASRRVVRNDELRLFTKLTRYNQSLLVSSGQRACEDSHGRRAAKSLCSSP